MYKILRRITIVAAAYYIWYFVIFTYVPSYEWVGTGFLLTLGVLWWRSRRRPVAPAEAEEIARRVSIDRRVPAGSDIRR